MQSCIEELYTFNKNSLENNTEEPSYNKQILIDKIKEVIAIMKEKEGKHISV